MPDERQGIVFSVIIVRIGLGIAIDPDTVQGSALSGKTLEGPDRRANVVHELSTFEASDNSTQGRSGIWPGVKVDLEKAVRSERSNADPSLKQERSVASQND